MAQITITEGLAEKKTILKRLQKKSQFVLTYLTRPEALQDPLRKEEGGAAGSIQREVQAMADLMLRYVAITNAIKQANLNNTIQIDKLEKSIADWLVWRKEIAPVQQSFYTMMQRTINAARETGKSTRRIVTSQGDQFSPTNDNLVVNYDEKALSSQAEELEAVLSALDGQLSLKNAQILIEV